MEDKPGNVPAQSQGEQPGKEDEMHPQPTIIGDGYSGSGKLKNKVALITGGDSGIGRAVAVHFAREQADIAIIYLEEDEDAIKTKEMVEREARKCLLLRGDVKDESFCIQAVEDTVGEFGKLDILVNNAAVQFPKDTLEAVSSRQMHETFQTNIYPLFHFCKAALKHLGEGSSIINTTSITAYRGSHHLLDYSSTKGAIVSFTRSLASSLAGKKIRVNAVAPGPIWTPLIPATFDEKKVSEFGKDTALGRPGQPSEVAPAYVFLASMDSSYIIGQVIHVNGGGFTSS